MFPNVPLCSQTSLYVPKRPSMFLNVSLCSQTFLDVPNCYLERRFYQASHVTQCPQVSLNVT